MKMSKRRSIADADIAAATPEQQRMLADFLQTAQRAGAQKTRGQRYRERMQQRKAEINAACAAIVEIYPQIPIDRAKRLAEYSDIRELFIKPAEECEAIQSARQRIHEEHPDVEAGLANMIAIHTTRSASLLAAYRYLFEEELPLE